MIRKQRIASWITTAGLASAIALSAGCQTMGMSDSQKVTLAGSAEVPPVTTSATGSGTVAIKDDRSVSASITVSGMTPTAAHIHEAGPGQNGPVIVPFTKTGDNTFEAPAGAKLTDAQYNAWKAGNLYVNVHSAKNPGGEVRAQLKAN